MKPIVEFRNVSKSFHGIRANDGLSFSVQPGSIHAIIGENGAGKSTAMKMLYGLFTCDEGEIYIQGQLWGGKLKPWTSPADAIRSGIGMVHQHFMLGEPYSVLDNILLGAETALSFFRFLPSFFRPIDRICARKELKRLMLENGLQVDLDAKVEDLPVGVQQRIEILKLLYHHAQILILDEPTAVLTPQETADLFAQLKRLAAEGKTILLITHKLKEVIELADRVTVFRMGTVVGEREILDTHAEELALLMVGRKVSLQGETLHRSYQIRQAQEPILEFKNLSLAGRRALHHLNLQVRAGEVVGIAGVEGNGQSELLKLVTHPADYVTQTSGSLRIFGQNVQTYSAQKIKEMGVGIIPEDRHRDALILEWSLLKNFLLGIHRRKPFYQNGLIVFSQAQKAALRALQVYDVRPALLHTKAAHFSGGNQQKWVIAREFQYAPRLLIAAQPTRGVDVGAVEFIHRKILEARDQGTGVLLISSELDEILSLSDRILVMYEGKFVVELPRGEVNEKILGLKMGGATTV